MLLYDTQHYDAAIHSSYAVIIISVREMQCNMELIVDLRISTGVSFRRDICALYTGSESRETGRRCGNNSQI